MDGDHMLVTWLPSPATAGQLEYRVVRGHNRAPAAITEGTTVDHADRAEPGHRYAGSGWD